MAGLSNGVLPRDSRNSFGCGVETRDGPVFVDRKNSLCYGREDYVTKLLMTYRFAIHIYLEIIFFRLSTLFDFRIVLLIES